MGSCAWLPMPRTIFRSDELVELLHGHGCGSAFDSLPLEIFHLIKQMVTHIRLQDERITNLEQRHERLHQMVVQWEEAANQPEGVTVSAALIEEAFADLPEAGEGS